MRWKVGVVVAITCSLLICGWILERTIRMKHSVRILQTPQNTQEDVANDATSPYVLNPREYVRIINNSNQNNYESR
jgi:hypothetical protein